MSVLNLAGYKFVALNDLHALRARLKASCHELHLRGTILLAPEGINLFVAGAPTACENFQLALAADPRLHDIRFKASSSAEQPFRRMLVKIKREIITLRQSGVNPVAGNAPLLPPAELKRWLDEGRDVVLLDTRNAFEVALGSFAGALDLGLTKFGDFPDALAQLDPGLRDKPVVTFCTGGIRCDKAAPLLVAAGFRQVYRLEGGILQYFEDCGSAHFRGECFVFDQRLALNGRLGPADAPATSAA